MIGNFKDAFDSEVYIPWHKKVYMEEGSVFDQDSASTLDFSQLILVAILSSLVIVPLQGLRVRSTFARRREKVLD